MLTKIHHVGIVVRSADQALEFYRDSLGLRVTKDAVIEDQGIRGVLLAAGDGELELLEPVRAGTGVARFLDSRGEGLHHLCFATDDIEAELASARAKNLPLIDQQPRAGLAGMIAFLHPKAANGVLIEYAQPPPWQASHGEPISDGGVQNLDHVSIAVQDLDAAVQLFADHFDLRESGRNDYPELGVRNAILPIGSAFIEPLTVLSLSSPAAAFFQGRTEGLVAVALTVNAIDRLVQSLQKGGWQVPESAVIANVRRVLIPGGLTHGVPLQLLERSA